MIGNNFELMYSHDDIASLTLTKTKNDPSTQEFCLEKKLYIDDTNEICQKEISILIFLN